MEDKRSRTDDLCYYSKGDFQADTKMGIWIHHRKAAQCFTLMHIQRSVAVLEEFSHKMVGVENNNDSVLLKEMTGKLNAVLYRE